MAIISGTKRGIISDTDPFLAQKVHRCGSCDLACTSVLQLLRTLYFDECDFDTLMNGNLMR